MSRLFAVVAALVFASLLAPASAKARALALVTTDQGCTAYWEYSPGLSTTRFSWEGSGCEQGQPINGEGMLIVKEKLGSGATGTIPYRGRVIDGALDGRIERLNKGSCSWSAPFDSCPWKVFDTREYRMGCEVSSGVILGSCTPRKRPRVNIAVPTSPPPVRLVQPQASPTRSASAATGGTGDVFGRCVRITRYPDDGGIQTVWAMNNVCSQPVIVSYCFKANVQAAGNPNLCSRREKLTYEIRGNGKIDFPFTLVEKGQAMSDGTLAGPNSLSVLGFACTGGAFPNVYFDEGKFLSRGC